MSVNSEIFKNYTMILKEDLVAAMGCTEPIAISYAAAKARQELGEMPERIKITCSGNIIKNVKGVTVPNSGGQKGIEIAAILGATAGNADRMPEVISDIADEARITTKRLAAAGICEVELAENVPNLYIKAEMWANGHRAAVTVEEHHTDITRIEKDDRTVFVSEKKVASTKHEALKGDRTKMTLHGIIDYADSVSLSEVEDILEKQVRFNTAISQEGLDNPWGARVGKTILENWSDDVKCCACARAAITYMSGGTYEQIGGTITNTLGNVGGIVCDGAKPSCAAKIASSVHAALLAHYMSISRKEFPGGEGFVESDVEKTIKNMGYIGKIGMKETDREVT